ncbi:unnamed protein product [Rotaria sp. Silwood2]|nr:unnamed protein product [Rotaria sp. Silwood2]CAF3416066.1 unnamed protein product [Rotaria sp. Silwood2]CAF4336501.1 unnamed protein product [Rotaria sp. Silwood2]CAF4478177.1 unnamed protein product [Rotaria sp. Silwood2]
MDTNNSGKSMSIRVTDFSPLPKQMLAAIDGYENMPLVSIEEAVKPLLNIVPKVERNVHIVKQNCGNPKNGLTTDESASIMLYTYESIPHEKSLYVILNKALRSEERQKLVPWFLYLRLVLTALARLPSERLFVNRGVRKDLHEEYSKGSTFIWWGFSSCTSSVEVLESDMFLGKSGTRTLFQIDCHTGKSIKNHSFLTKKDEILLLPARQFKVKSCLNSGNGLHIIQLKEIDPPYPLLEPVPIQKSIGLVEPNINIESQVTDNKSQPTASSESSTVSSKTLVIPETRSGNHSL